MDNSPGAPHRTRMTGADSHVTPWANLEWRSEATPASVTHDDIYWSRDAGLAEKHHVFIEGNHLATRFKGNHRTHFTMLEVGFGFGLNFLLTAKTWRSSAPQQSILNYIAIEKTPVAPADLARLYAALARAEGFNERHATQLLHHYPTPYPGTHTIWVAEDIALTLVIGDLKDVLGDIDASADAWFLDGFSPARNADAWTRELFSAMPRMSQPGATFSTYSVAGEVRRGLASAGFEVRRSPGFGTKAEMLSGVLPGTWQAQTLGSGRIAVIGAGIAGLNCARALARRHLDVTVYDQAGALAGASSIPGLAMSPHLAVRPHVGSLFSLAALQYATRFSDEVHVTGRFTLASNETDETRLQRIGDTFPDSIARYLNAREAGRLPGMNACGPGLYFAPGGWLEPAILARKVRVTAKQVTGMTTGASPRLQFADGQIEDFDGIIIATGAGPLPQTAPLSFEPVRGQAIQVLAPGLGLTRVIGGPLYVIPRGEDEYLVGATWDQQDDDPSPRSQDTRRLLRRLTQRFDIQASVTAEYAGIRCTTRDRTPVVGALPVWPALDQYCDQYRAGLRHAGHPAPFSEYERRTFVCTGFGSHGATHAPLCGEYLARMITGESSCLGKTWSRRLDPARLQIRQARKPSA